MGVTRAMEDMRPAYVAPVQDDAEQVRKQESAALVSAQGSIVEELQIPPIVVQRKRMEVPIQEKVLLTLDEAAEYTGLGMQKLRDISNFESCKFVLWNDTKRMFKREMLKAYLLEAYSI